MIHLSVKSAFRTSDRSLTVVCRPQWVTIKGNYELRCPDYGSRMRGQSACTDFV